MVPSSPSTPFEILPQPDEETCGPTSLHAVYRHYGEDLTLEDVISQVQGLETGGTLGVLLATHALQRGYRSVIYSYNLQLFDPTWSQLSNEDLVQKLRQQCEAKPTPRFQIATQAYCEYLQAGGEVRQEDFDEELLDQLLAGGRPVVVGLCATALYGGPRELPDTTLDDVRGESSGHFVVLLEHSVQRRTVTVADPYSPNPFGSLVYEVPLHRFLAALYLGVLTFDANLIVLQPPTQAAGATTWSTTLR
jgi:hypothetical protein